MTPPPIATDVALRAVQVETPFGLLCALVTPEDGMVRASGFGTLAGVSRGLPRPLAERGWEERDVPSVSAAIRAWLGGDRSALAKVPAAQVGGAFMQRVWLAMRTIPAGETVTYGELASLAGNPKAARAAGHACATNGLAPFVPCHRVVASTGIGNYGLGGTEVKRRMLAFEGAEIAKGTT